MNSAIAAELWAHQNAYRAPLMVIYKQRFLKRRCISIIIRHDLVVTVMYLSLAGLLNWRTVAIQQNNRNHCIVAHMKNVTEK